jgi:hypothetical protein
MHKNVLFFLLWVLACVPLVAENAPVGLTYDSPSRWQTAAPLNPFRVAQWSIPAWSRDADAGEVVVFYFGRGQGGDAASNISRWQRTLSTPEGAKAEVELKERNVAGMKVSEVVAYGIYSSAVPMAGVPPVPKPGYGLAGAVVETPQGDVFVRMVGPEKLVKSNLATFRQLVDSIRMPK